MAKLVVKSADFPLVAEVQPEKGRLYEFHFGTTFENDCVRGPMATLV